MSSKFKKVRTVTSAVLKLREGQPRYIFFLSPMYVGEKIDEKKEAATLAQVVDMETGETGILIISAVMKSELLKAYPKSAFVRKGFEVVLNKRAGEGATYNHVSISEVAPPDDWTAPDSVPVPEGAALVEVAPARGDKPKK